MTTEQKNSFVAAAEPEIRRLAAVLGVRKSEVDDFVQMATKMLLEDDLSDYDPLQRTLPAYRWRTLKDAARRIKRDRRRRGGTHAPKGGAVLDGRDVSAVAEIERLDDARARPAMNDAESELLTAERTALILGAFHRMVRGPAKTAVREVGRLLRGFLLNPKDGPSLVERAARSLGVPESTFRDNLKSGQSAIGTAMRAASATLSQSAQQIPLAMASFKDRRGGSRSRTAAGDVVLSRKAKP